MVQRKALPDRSELIDFNYAVAGHAGTLCDPNGELFIKPCTQAEISFYQSALESHPDFADLMPVFMGSLALNDATDVQSINEQLPAVQEHISTEMKEQVAAFVADNTKPEESIASKSAPRNSASAAPSTTASAQPNPDGWLSNANRKIITNSAVVLENAAHGFKRPNIVDVKLGTRLWADDAPAEKKRRFDKIAAETTHKDFGFRIAGMRVYKGAEEAEKLDKEDYRIYGKDYGRFEVNKDNVVDSFRSFIFNKASGVDEEIGKAVADAFRRDLEHVRDVLEKQESRMYSSSLLFVFEGDGAALRAAVDETSASTTSSSAKPAVAAAVAHAQALSRSTPRVDSGIDMDEDGEMLEKANVGEEYTGETSSDEEVEQPHIYSLKLIDFAHAQWTPGQGPDENVLLGVRSLIKIFAELAQ